MEQLEKIKLDLETLGQVSEIADTGYIGKIEGKLPIQISMDWRKTVTDEELENYSGELEVIYIHFQIANQLIHTSGRRR